MLTRQCEGIFTDRLTFDVITLRPQYESGWLPWRHLNHVAKLSRRGVTNCDMLQGQAGRDIAGAWSLCYWNIIPGER